MKTWLIVLFTLTNLYAKDSLDVITYNLGLAHTFVPLAKERLPYLVEALKKSQADVLCLQEVWTKKDQKKILKGLKDIYPYSFKTQIKNVKSKRRPTCKVKEIFGEGKFVGCMQTQCKNLDGDEFTDCIIERCGDSLSNLKNENRECATSLMAQVGKSTLAGMITILNPLKRAGLFAYKGSNGLMLFSKYPMEAESYQDFKDISTLNKRGALVADIETPKGLLNVMCTHIAADLSKTVPYTGVFENWGEENYIQFEKLIQKASGDNTPTVLMGDFNCGPSLPARGVSGELEANCNQINSTKFSNTLLDKGGDCTFCASNSLNDGEEASYMIDHIYVKGLKVNQAEILFKDPISVKSEGEAIKTNLSDHFGVKANIQFK